MDPLSWNLALTALGLGVAHTAAGPDHTLPFVMLARARGWSLARTLGVTFACGLGHIGSSLLLGMLGLALGVGVSRLGEVESARGEMAAWGLVLFGAAYALWGIRRALRRRGGIVLHEHRGHLHLHPRGDAHHHHPEEEKGRTTFWVLFTVFVLGPCEPLIPLFVLPASIGRWGAAALTGVVFAVATLATMLLVVGLALTGFRRIPLGFLARWSHALAGGTIAASGLAVLWLGL